MMRAIFVSLLLLLSACGEQQWRTKDIGGLMPQLEFRLVGENGRKVRAEDYRGRVRLLFFGYTFCPDVCPATLARLAAAVDQLPEAQAKDVRVLFVSVDPKRDDPQRLAAYTGAFGEQFVGLTGNQDSLRELTKRYRVTYSYGEPDAQGNYLVSHSSAVFVFDDQGNVELLFRDDDSVEAMAADLRQLAQAG